MHYPRIRHHQVDCLPTNRGLRSQRRRCRAGGHRGHRDRLRDLAGTTVVRRPGGGAYRPAAPQRDHQLLQLQGPRDVLVSGGRGHVFEDVAWSYADTLPESVAILIPQVSTTPAPISSPSCPMVAAATTVRCRFPPARERHPLGHRHHQFGDRVPHNPRTRSMIPTAEIRSARPRPTGRAANGTGVRETLPLREVGEHLAGRAHPTEDRGDFTWQLAIATRPRMWVFSSSGPPRRRLMATAAAGFFEGRMTIELSLQPARSRRDAVQAHHDHRGLSRRTDE